MPSCRTGNVTAVEDVQLEQLAMSTYVPPTSVEDINDIFEDEDATPSPTLPRLAPLLENIVIYIGGWVVRKVLSKLSCECCRIAMVCNEPSAKYGQSYFFLKLKNNGGLVFPSEGVVDVITSAEHHLRHLKDAKPSLALLHLQTMVLSDIGTSDIFGLSEHIYDTQEGLDNHHLTLVRLLVGIYFDVRQYYIVKLQNLKLQGSQVRHKLSKTILFLGQ